MSDQIEALRMKLKSAIKAKLQVERNVGQARNREQSLNDQLAMVKAEIEFLKEQLEDVQKQMAQSKLQISMIEICSTSEKIKIDAHINNLEHHKNGFQQLFDMERHHFDIRMEEIYEKEAEAEEAQRQKEREIAEKNEREMREAAAIEIECEALEKECTILKKRNNAIMLQLRRKLLETENARRELNKRSVPKCD